MKLLIVAITSLTLFVSCAHTHGKEAATSCGCQDKKATCSDCGGTDKKMKPGGCKDCDGGETK